MIFHVLRSACRLAVVLPLVLLTLSSTAHAALNFPPSQWYKLPGLNALSGAQWVRSIAYSTPPNVVYAGLEGGGVFKSVNGGASWSAFNSGFPNPQITNVRALLSSSTGTTVYAGTDDGIYKSTGGAWAPLAQGTEDDPAHPTKLNQSVQSLISLTGGSTMLAGVFSGGVYKSGDGGETWSPPPVNSGIPTYESIYSLTENVPGLVYATGHGGVYLSINQGSTWTRVSDGIPGGASPITTWVYPQRPQILFTSTGSDGIYRSINAGITWSPINAGLGAVRTRGLQIFTSSVGAHVYAATEEGLWESLTSNAVNPPPPHWHQVTQEGLHETNPVAHNVIMWALSAPVIPSQGAVGVIAGTQSNGGYFLAFEPVDSPCPANHTNNVTSNCPRITDPASVQDGRTLTMQGKGTWTGTPIIDYEYQWQRCTSTTEVSCTDIPDAEETSYTVPQGASGVSPSALRYRLEVTATNPAPSFGLVKRYSAITSPASASPTTAPGYQQACAPPIVVQAPGSLTSPEVGDTMYAANGSCSAAVDPIYEWFNPAATTVSYRWLRCENSGTDCNEIPGAAAAGRSYVLTPADGSHELRVRVTGTGNGFTYPLLSAPSYDVISTPATIADPFVDPDTGVPQSQAPALLGDAYVGETIAGSVGGWKDPTTDFLRRWVRCDADGMSCTYIQEAGSTDPETGSTYTVRPEDLGSTLRLRVTADVNYDFTHAPPTGGDGIDNHLPNAVEVDTPASAVVSYRPVSGVGGAGGGPPGGDATPGPDKTKPTIIALTLTKSKFKAGKGTVFKLRISEKSSIRVVISRATSGRLVAKKCRTTTRANRKRKHCTYDKTLTTIRRAGVAAGNVAISFSGKIGKHSLKLGTYRATFIVTDAAGNATSKSLIFKIVRR